MCQINQTQPKIRTRRLILLKPLSQQNHFSIPYSIVSCTPFVKFIIKLTATLITLASPSDYILLERFFNMCFIYYIMYDRCDHWVEQCLPNGEPVRLCRQAEEERLGFACPQTQREHVVVERSQGFCKDCEYMIQIGEESTDTSKPTSHCDIDNETRDQTIVNTMRFVKKNCVELLND